MNNNYDTIIIGAGMSGLAAGIRLAMFDKKVCIVESHSIPGGLNSYYSRGKRRLDVGLHAMTNFVPKGTKRSPLTKLLRQLRIPYDSLKLAEQNYSKIRFPSTQLNFSNDQNTFIKEIESKFPQEIENFKNLLIYLNEYDEVNLNNSYFSAKAKLNEFIHDELLIEMIIAPLLIYGSAWENDMDFSQFAIMFKSIYIEGFSRPHGGVRTVINLLLKKYSSLGGEIFYNSEVKDIQTLNNKVESILLKNGKSLNTNNVLSSAGLPETLRLIKSEINAITAKLPPEGKMSFTESIFYFDKTPKDYNINETIIFYNNKNVYDYKMPKDLCDFSSAVICFPNNYKYANKEIDETINGEGIIRITFMANFDKWNNLDKVSYKKQKNIVLDKSLELIKKNIPNFDANLLYSDVFTPRTVKKYTGKINGAVYGSTKKSRTGKTHIENLFICGTDQGFLGIVGAMLSGISMANLHCLIDGEIA